MTKWIEDWFGSEYYSLLYKHRGCDEAKLFLDNLFKFLKIPSGNSILDCGCGKGRHSIYLNEKGFQVTGIDISENSIIEAKTSEKENLSFYVHDMRNLFRINYYDVVLNLFTSFGYFEKDYENNKAIKSTASALKKNGWFVLDFMNVKKEIKALIAQEKCRIDEVDFEIRRYAEKKSIIKEICFLDKGKSYSYKEKVKSYRRKDLETFFIQNKLELVYLFGDYHLAPFSEETSERLILIGRK
ncbi:MAG: class I SAM-dependent methyltransferase [Bacteroidetes bacterium]|nr:class I SAM-dependent methyltransferase [Bacteroidota bacterium]